MKNLPIKIALSISLALPALAQDFTVGVLDATNEIQAINHYDIANERKVLAAEKIIQDTYQQEKTEIQDRIKVIESQLGTSLADAISAHNTAKQIRDTFIKNKKVIPRDPWREIYGKKTYVLSSEVSFLKFSGQILEVAPNGIRVLGDAGDLNGVEYFVLNFPYNFEVGESVDPSNIYVAVADGKFSYVSEDGFAKSLPKFNYGKPCAKPSNSAEVELKAQSFSAQEERQLAAAEESATLADETVKTHEKKLRQAKEELANNEKKAQQELQQTLETIIQYDQSYADKGDLFALRRMSERYRKGDGVAVDLKKSKDYKHRAEVAFEVEANRISQQLNEQENQALRQKFLRNLELADKKQNPMSALYVEKCYREGLGTEKDLKKADEYHAKAVAYEIPSAPNRAKYEPF